MIDGESSESEQKSPEAPVIVWVAAGIAVAAGAIAIARTCLSWLGDSGPLFDLNVLGLWLGAALLRGRRTSRFWTMVIACMSVLAGAVWVIWDPASDDGRIRWIGAVLAVAGLSFLRVFCQPAVKAWFDLNSRPHSPLPVGYWGLVAASTLLTGIVAAEKYDRLNDLKHAQPVSVLLRLKDDVTGQTLKWGVTIKSPLLDLQYQPRLRRELRGIERLDRRASNPSAGAMEFHLSGILAKAEEITIFGKACATEKVLIYPGAGHREIEVQLKLKRELAEAEAAVRGD